MSKLKNLVLKAVKLCEIVFLIVGTLVMFSGAYLLTTTAVKLAAVLPVTTLSIVGVIGVASAIGGWAIWREMRDYELDDLVSFLTVGLFTGLKAACQFGSLAFNWIFKRGEK